MQQSDIDNLEAYICRACDNVLVSAAKRAYDTMHSMAPMYSGKLRASIAAIDSSGDFDTFVPAFSGAPGKYTAINEYAAAAGENNFKIKRTGKLGRELLVGVSENINSIGKTWPYSPRHINLSYMSGNKVNFMGFMNGGYAETIIAQGGLIAMGGASALKDSEDPTDNPF